MIPAREHERRGGVLVEGTAKVAALKLLVMQVGSSLGAVRSSDVVEVCRPLATEPVSGLPPFVLGLSVVRGAPVPVVDLGRLLGWSPQAPARRFVMLKSGERRLALAVESVAGLCDVDADAFEEAPSLLAEAPREHIEVLAALDRRLLVLLRAQKILPRGVWEAFEKEAQRS
jgi:purine-binding chemotaxis protein CheW